MDPNENLRKQLELAKCIQEQHDTEERESVDPADANELAELVIALDKWIWGGGFLPQRWEQTT